MDGERALDEIWRVLRLGGYLYMIVPNGMLEAMFGSADTTHLRLYNYNSIQYLLRGCGFKVTDIKASGFPLLNKINFRLARKVARCILHGPLLSLASPSFWIKAKKINRKNIVIVSNPAAWGGKDVMGGAEMRVLNMYKESKCGK